MHNQMESDNSLITSRGTWKREASGDFSMPPFKTIRSEIALNNTEVIETIDSKTSNGSKQEEELIDKYNSLQINDEIDSILHEGVAPGVNIIDIRRGSVRCYLLCQTPTALTSLYQKLDNGSLAATMQSIFSLLLGEAEILQVVQTKGRLSASELQRRLEIFSKNKDSEITINESELGAGDTVESELTTIDAVTVDLVSIRCPRANLTASCHCFIQIKSTSFVDVTSRRHYTCNREQYVSMCQYWWGVIKERNRNLRKLKQTFKESTVLPVELLKAAILIRNRLADESHKKTRDADVIVLQRLASVCRRWKIAMLESNDVMQRRRLKRTFHLLNSILESKAQQMIDRCRQIITTWDRHSFEESTKFVFGQCDPLLLTDLCQIFIDKPHYLSSIQSLTMDIFCTTMLQTIETFEEDMKDSKLFDLFSTVVGKFFERVWLSDHQIMANSMLTVFNKLVSCDTPNAMRCIGAVFEHMPDDCVRLVFSGESAAVKFADENVLKIINNLIMMVTWPQPDNNGYLADWLSVYLSGLATVNRHALVSQFDGIVEQNFERQSINTASSAKIKRSEIIRHTGLTNRMNTCFVNVVLQLLFMCDSFSQQLFKAELKSSQILLTELQKVFAFLTFSQRTSFTPSAFIAASQPKWFNEKQQQDCCEYLNIVFDLLNEEENQGETSMVNQSFAGHLLRRLHCESCNKESVNEEPFLILPLTLPSHSPAGFSTSLVTLIENSLCDEKLVGDNQFWCRTCKAYQNAERSTVIGKAPPNLILNLIRFGFEDEKRFKIMTHVRYPLSFNLPIRTFGMSGTEAVSEKTYGLVGVVVHSGVSSDEGHYKCYARHAEQLPLSDNKDQRSVLRVHGDVNTADYFSSDWYSFNDENVTSASFRDATTQTFATDTAYVLVYREVIDSSINGNNSTPVSLREMVDRDNTRYSEVLLQEQQRRSVPNPVLKVSESFSWIVNTTLLEGFLPPERNLHMFANNANISENQNNTEKVLIALWNCRGLSAEKADIIQQTAVNSSFDVFLIQEPWHTSQNDLLVRQSYDRKYYRMTQKHRPSGQPGGGNIILFKHKYTATRIMSRRVEKADFKTFELLLVKLSSEGRYMVIAAVYRPCSHPATPAFFVELDILADMLKPYGNHCVIVGDLNVHVNYINARSTTFFTVLDKYGLVQCVKEETHVAGNTLDLVISRRMAEPTRCDVTDICTKSDHFLVTAVFEAIQFDST